VPPQTTPGYGKYVIENGKEIRERQEYWGSRFQVSPVNSGDNFVELLALNA
jgi:hypothetical protein